MSKSNIMLSLSALVVLLMVSKSFILDESVKFYLLIFIVVGLGLAALRLLVNGSIKKMKGKALYVKIIFFTVLLGLGIPFQNWFRTDVIMKMSSEYILPCIITGVCSLIFFTVLYGKIYQKAKLSHLETK